MNVMNDSLFLYFFEQYLIIIYRFRLQIFLNNSTTFGIKGFFHIDPLIIVAISPWNNINPLEHYQFLAFFTHCLFDLKILVMNLRKQTIVFLRQIELYHSVQTVWQSIIHNTSEHNYTQIVTPAQCSEESYRPLPAVCAHKCQLSPADAAHDCQPASPPSNVSIVHSPTDHTNCSRSGNPPTQVKLSPGPTDGQFTDKNGQVSVQSIFAQSDEPGVKWFLYWFKSFCTNISVWLHVLESLCEIV